MTLAHVAVIKNINNAVVKSKNFILQLVNVLGASLGGTTRRDTLADRLNPKRLKHILQQILNRKTILYWFAVLTFILTKVLIKYPNITEKYYSNSFYKIIATVLSKYSSLFPFSINDVFLITLIPLLLTIIVALILKKKCRKTMLPIIFKTIAIIYIGFYWLWGFNYFRHDIYKRLNIEANQITNENFNAAFYTLINQTNNLKVSFADFDKQITDSIIEKSYSKNAHLLAISYPLGKRRPKNMTISRFFAASGIGGYFGPFFNEIHLNKFIPPIQYPMILAHEKAHQFGITSEAEANFYAWFVCSKSQNEQIQYSASLYVLFHFLHYNKRQNNSIDAYKLISDDVANDIQIIRNYWSSLRYEPIEKVNTWFNDKYLKFNNIPNGVENYSGVVKLLIDYKRQSEI